MSRRSWHMSKGQGLKNLPGLDQEYATFATVFKNASSEAIIYAPKTRDWQEPHDRDEFYVVLSGYGDFINGDTRHSFKPCDILFIPAYQPHRFVDFSDDFATWVIFYGPTEDPPFWSES